MEEEEDEDTFVGNASKKAREVYNVSHEEAIADDSGLCVNCLKGFPGVMTHRFLGDNKTDEERNIALIEKANALSDRSGKVVCVLVYYAKLKTSITKVLVLNIKIEWEVELNYIQKDVMQRILIGCF